MKISIALICILAEVVCIYGQRREEMIMKKMEECRLEIVAQGVNHDAVYSRDLGMFEKCFEACVLDKLGLMENGKFILEKVVTWKPEGLSFHPEKEIAMLKICVESANKEKDKCEVAGKMSRCVNERILNRQVHHSME